MFAFNDDLDVRLRDDTKETETQLLPVFDVDRSAFPSRSEMAEINQP